MTLQQIANYEKEKFINHERGNVSDYFDDLYTKFAYVFTDWVRDIHPEVSFEDDMDEDDWRERNRAIIEEYTQYSFMEDLYDIFQEEEVDDDILLSKN